MYMYMYMYVQARARARVRVCCVCTRARARLRACVHMYCICIMLPGIRHARGLVSGRQARGVSVRARDSAEGVAKSLVDFIAELKQMMADHK